MRRVIPLVVNTLVIVTALVGCDTTHRAPCVHQAAPRVTNTRTITLVDDIGTARPVPTPLPLAPAEAPNAPRAPRNGQDHPVAC